MCKKLVVLILLCLTSLAWANVSIENPFSNNAVLQRQKPVPVWGTANSGEQVTVDFNGQSKSTTANGNGDWMVYLDPMPASTAPSDMVITGNNVVTITGVQVGEVWLFSGQSNIWFAISSADGGDEAIADMPNHNIMSFRIGFNARNIDRVPWKANETGCSAVAYFMCHELSHALGNIPIGMLQASRGGTSISEWTHASSPSDGQEYEWKVEPMQPYAIRGFVWYQGDSDMTTADAYEFNLNGLISEWRTDFQQGVLPVGIVQLQETGLIPNRPEWPVVQNAHLQVHLNGIDTGLAVTWDLSTEGSSGHSTTKQPIGERLALWARSEVYGEPGLVYSSPIPNQAASYINGNEIVVAFDHIGGGLVTNDGQPSAHFEVAGSDGVRHVANAQIVGNTVVVSSPAEPAPVTVTHVWTDQYWPLSGALGNAEGLPAPVFKMDLVSSSYCDDETCDPGEDQCNCPEDCGTPPATETNCFDGADEDCDTFTDCDDSDCDGDPACPSCGDTYCDIGEDQCNCPDDCGTPPSTETNCTDGIDNDCGGGTDCDDSDCDTDPACVEPYCGDANCDPGEDQCNCSDDCGTPPSTETNCTDGIDNDCGGGTDCDDSDCDGDPACPDCLPKNAPCTDNIECCSGNCLPAGKCAR
jgi:sialate O-acetylesterase